MPFHATAQLIGGRSHQCDATATYTYRGTRAYALLDGIGSTEEVQTWTQTAARRLARAAAYCGATVGLRAVHAARAAELARADWYAEYMPKAVAVVAVAAPGRDLEVAWCGDARAYRLPATTEQLSRLTTDHNRRQQLLDMDVNPGPYSRNIVTSYLGDTSPHVSIGSVTAPNSGRLLLASDGAYEPLEDAELTVANYLVGPPPRAAQTLVSAAIEHGGSRADNATVLVVDLGG
ncbi:mucin-2 [Streptomyces sp. NPDC051130]|uniref:PP2C family protein-serine/threonine phosphatase n=1 Tax=Streptomyces sp. NPDC051130 TaxID=3157223 RepID=UPI003419722B